MVFDELITEKVRKRQNIIKSHEWSYKLYLYLIFRVADPFFKTIMALLAQIAAVHWDCWIDIKLFILSLEQVGPFIDKSYFPLILNY